MPFGQLVIGPPGSGKSTYCRGMQEYLRKAGRQVEIINLDPANFVLPYECNVNISSLVTLDDVMDELHLGPNGGMIYCMEFLEKNLDWFEKILLQHKDKYVLIDCPGQVELYTHHHSVRNIVHFLQKKLNYRLCAVHLVDSHYCTDPTKFISVLLTSLSTMLQVELPHVNVLSKMDLIEKYDKLAFNIDFYTEVMDLKYLIDCISQDTFFAKFKKLNAAICDVVQDYNLVNFLPLMVEDPALMLRLTKTIDKANGYIFGGLEEGNDSIFSVVTNNDIDILKDLEVQEKYIQDLL